MDTHARVAPQVDIERRTSGPAQAMTSAKKIKLINDSTHVSLLRPSIDELAAISGCHVTRPPDATFGEPEFEREYFIKSMLCRYADGQAFTYSEINGKKSIVEEGWCCVLNKMLGRGIVLGPIRCQSQLPYVALYDPFVRIKIKTAFECPNVDVLPKCRGHAELPHRHPLAEMFTSFLFHPGWKTCPIGPPFRKCEKNQLFKAIQLTQYVQFPTMKRISVDSPHPIASRIRHFLCYPGLQGHSVISYGKCKKTQLFKALQLNRNNKELGQIKTSIKSISDGYPHPIAGVMWSVIQPWCEFTCKPSPSFMKLYIHLKKNLSKTSYHLGHL